MSCASKDGMSGQRDCLPVTSPDDNDPDESLGGALGVGSEAVGGGAGALGASVRNGRGIPVQGRYKGSTKTVAREAGSPIA
jgi:hypothetical protein